MRTPQTPYERALIQELKRSLRPPNWRPATRHYLAGTIARAARAAWHNAPQKPDRTQRAQIYWAAYRAGQIAQREAEEG